MLKANNHDGREALRNLNANVGILPPKEASGVVMAKVLIIDDDELFIKLMVHALRQRGHDVEFALDGLAGSRKFETAQYDIVICDIVMPEQEGVETIKIMRRARPDVKIVAISGGLSLSHTTNIDVLHIAGQFGADATLKKPFQLSDLATTVDRVLNSPSPAQAVANG